MYLELTPEDTIKDLQNLLIQAIPGFEFPRINLYDYTILVVEKYEDQVEDGDFVIGVLWNDTLDDIEIPKVLVEESAFNVKLTMEEVNILALLMKEAWVQRQVTSVENIRMKYSGKDFKFTSQANHLSKLMSLLNESRRDAFHMQRLYKRRKLNEDGYSSNWSVFRSNRVID